MSVVVLLIVLGVIVFLLAKSLQDAKRQQASGQPKGAGSGRQKPRPAVPRPSGRTRPRRRQPALDEDALAAHVVKLREAISTGLISTDEAIESIVRQTDGALGEDAARKLLSTEDDAA